MGAPRLKLGSGTRPEPIVGLAGDSLGRAVADEGSEVIDQDANHTVEDPYEPPLLTTIGSIAELTLVETTSSAVTGPSKPV